MTKLFKLVHKLIYFWDSLVCLSIRGPTGSSHYHSPGMPGKHYFLSKILLYLTPALYTRFTPLKAAIRYASPKLG